MILEVCVDSIASVRAAVDGGADRLELCSALCVGGLMPSEGFLAETQDLFPDVDRRVMIRPRCGDFVYSDDEASVALRDIETARRFGATGFVFGALREGGEIDAALCRRVVDAARPLPVTFHRAFDFCSQPLKALDELIDIGFDRLLTSGQAPSAIEGVDLLRALVQRGGVVVIAAAGVEIRNVRELVARTGVTELHASASVADSPRDSPLFVAGILRTTSEVRVRALVETMRETGSQ